MNNQFIKNVEASINKITLTNLYLFEILLENLIENPNNPGLSNIEINTTWAIRQNQKRYSKNFAETYCSRKVTQGSLYFDQSTKKYKIPNSENDNPIVIPNELLERVKEIIEQPNPIASKLDLFRNLEDPDMIYQNVEKFLLEGNSTDFEVISFSILQLYFKQFGFTLYRFSSTTANDGGVDFIGGNLVYCVTTELNKKKLTDDIEKTFSSKVFVHRNKLSDKINEKINQYVLAGKIYSVINTEMLLNHFLSHLTLMDHPTIFHQNLRR